MPPTEAQVAPRSPSLTDAKSVDMATRLAQGGRAGGA
jgi:hypothetical protein